MSTTTEADRYPILFSAPLVRAILRGEKTQTRRVVKPQPNEGVTSYAADPPGEAIFRYSDRGVSRRQKCPYGQTGDVLMVREAFRLPEVNDEVSPSDYVDAGLEVVRYEANGEQRGLHESQKAQDGWGRLRPSIHMPYDLVRMRLRVEDVRVERVQDITKADAIAEGVTGHMADKAYKKRKLTTGSVSSYIDAFADLWDEINAEHVAGAYAWSEDPWCWVLEFSRIEDPEAI